MADTAREAHAAAERAVVPALFYDAATLDEDQTAAAGLPHAYREDHDQLLSVIRESAPQPGTAVSVDVLSSGVLRSGDDRVEVLVLGNRPTTNQQQSEPKVYRDQDHPRPSPGQVLDSGPNNVHHHRQRHSTPGLLCARIRATLCVRPLSYALRPARWPVWWCGGRHLIA